MKLFLISNSTNPGEPYLGWVKNDIEQFLLRNKIEKALFIPFAGVNLQNPKTLEESYDNYEKKVQAVFPQFASVHRSKNPIEAIETAECIVVGGGNTFHLVYELHRQKLMDAIRKRTLEGTPYIGWSAGSNIASPTLRTTNDMPIIEPESFNCLNLIPFQINPHYLDTENHPKNFGGETREDRINEFLAVNKNVTVVGLREASLLEVDGKEMKIRGKHEIRIFQYGNKPREESSDVSFLLNT